MQFLVVGVFRNAGVETVIQIVDATNKIVSVDMAVGHQRATMQAAAVKNRHLIVETYDDQIDLADNAIFGFPVFKRFKRPKLDLLHCLLRVTMPFEPW